MSYEVEYIPDEHRLFRRVPENFWNDLISSSRNSEWLKKGRFPPNLFKYPNEDQNLSADWCKYAKAEDTKNRASPCQVNGVVAFEVGSVRMDNLSVTHNPLCDNQAHSLISAENESHLRKSLSSNAEWVKGLSLHTPSNLIH